jgi:hypothetical protein
MKRKSRKRPSLARSVYFYKCIQRYVPRQSNKQKPKNTKKKESNDSRSGGSIMILNSKQVRRERRYKTTPVSDHQLRHSGLRQCNAELNQQSRKLDAKQISSRRRGTTSMHQRLYVCFRLLRVRWWWCESTV